MTQTPKRRSDSVNELLKKAFPEVLDTEREPVAPEDIDARERWLRENIPPHHE